jgi:phosphatidylglycerophosphate synthase
MLGKLVRKAGDRAFRPINAGLARAGVKSQWVYALALASAAASGVMFLGGRRWAGLVLLVLHGILDYLDGGLRRARGQGDQRARWLGMDAHAVVDKVSEVILFAGLAGGGWVGWPLAIGAGISSLAVTVVGGSARRWAGVDPSRALFDRADRLFVLLLAGVFRAFDTALGLVCAMNGVILLQRAVQVLLAPGPGDRAT